MFKCEQCGICCKNLDKSELYKGLDRGDGTCRFLVGDLCSIYSERPLLCRVTDSYYAFFDEKYSLEEYLQLNYEGCKKLQKNKLNREV